MTDAQPTTPELIREAFAIVHSDEEVDDARLEAYLEARTNRLRALRYVRNAAMARRQFLLDEAERLVKIATGHERTAKRCEGLAFGLLRAEREMNFGAEDETYKADLGDGIKMVLRVRHSSAVVVALGTELADDLVRVTREPDKVKLKKCLEMGMQIPGVAIVERTSETVEGW